MKNIFLFTYFHLVTGLFYAQQDPQISMHFFNPLAYNPAYAGSRDAWSVLAMSRFQWVGFNGSPQTHWMSSHAPLHRYSMAVGGTLSVDRMGNRGRFSCFGHLASWIRTGSKDQRLAAGLNIGFDQLSYDFTQSNVVSNLDPYVIQSNTIVLPNIGAGFYWYGPRFGLGIGMPRTIPFRHNADIAKQNAIARHLFVSASGLLPIHAAVSIKPSAVLKVAEQSPVSLDVQCEFIFNELIWIGFQGRLQEGIGANLVVQINPMFRFGYVYELPTHALRTYQNGSHECFIQFDLCTKRSIVSSPRYF
jgi:type IX secretion system PorP/SprF family membrane protein